MKQPLLAILLLGTITAEGLADWEWVDPRPQGNGLASAARASDGTLIAVGASGACVRRESSSEDWISLPLFTTLDLLDVVFLGGRFLAIGPSAGLWASSDRGATWELENADIKGRYLFSLSDRVLVLNGLSSALSVNGSPFETSNLSAQGISGYRVAASSAGGVLLAGGSGLIARTTNGREWTVRQLGGPDHIYYALAGGESGFLLGGVKTSADGLAYEPVLFESPDGVDWTEVAPPAGTSVVYRLLAAPGGWFFQNSGDGRLFRRDAAGTWTPLTGNGLEGFAASASVRFSRLSDDAVLFDERGLIAQVDTAGAAIVHDVPLRSTGLLNPPRFTAAALGDLALVVDRNVAVSSENVVLRTTDGLHWSQLAPPPVTSLTALLASGGAITGFSSGDRNTESGFYRTTDGVSWNLVSAAFDPVSGGNLFSGDIVSLAARDDQSAVVALARRESFDLGGRYRGERGLYFSSDWVNWEPVALPELREDPPPFEDVIESVQWDGNRFILLVHPGRIFISPDGRTWSQLPALPDDPPARLQIYGQPTPPAANLAVSVASDGRQLVARAAKLAADAASYFSRGTGTPELFYVYDNNRWHAQPVSAEASPVMRRVLWDGTRFVATGNGELLTSPDGRGWSSTTLPARILSLIWTGNRYFGFTDSFGLLRHEGRLDEGAPVPLYALAPASTAVAHDGGTSTLSLQVPEQTAWQVQGVPRWMKVVPSSGTGPAELSVSYARNPAAVPRGAVLEIGALRHVVHQAGRRESPPLVAPPWGSNLTIRFSGAWDLAGDPRVAVVSRPAGKGNIRLKIPPNDSSAERTIALDINGTTYSVTQPGYAEVLSRGGTYEGLVGSLPAGLPADPRNFETFDGSASFVVTRPRGPSIHGAYSARFRIHLGGRNLVFAGSGALDAAGAVTAVRWKSRGKDPQQIDLEFRVNEDGPYGRTVTGRFALSDAPGDYYHFIAGKQVFRKDSPTLPAQHTGRATFFLGSFGSAGYSSEAGVGTARLTPGGTARLAVTTSDGQRGTASTIVWGSVGPDLVMPFAVNLAGGRRMMAGYLTADPTRDQHDWDGIAAWNNYPDKDVTYLSTFLCRYEPPPFVWAGGGAFTYTASDDAFNANVGLAGTRFVVEAASGEDEEPLPRVNVRYNPRTGLVSGTMRRPGFPVVRLRGAVNAKQYGFTRDRGTVLGLVVGSDFGSFGITPTSTAPSLP